MNFYIHIKINVTTMQTMIYAAVYSRDREKKKSNLSTFYMFLAVYRWFPFEKCSLQHLFLGNLWMNACNISYENRMLIKYFRLHVRYFFPILLAICVVRGSEAKNTKMTLCFLQSQKNDVKSILMFLFFFSYNYCRRSTTN